MGGQILELSPEDFNARPWVPGSGWPFPKKVLDQHYRRALEIEGIGKVITKDEDVWRSIGIPRPELGTEIVPFFSRWCAEPNFARLFGRELRDHPRIHVFLHANVCEILLTDRRDGISGLRARSMGRDPVLCFADTYVLCLGGIETPRLLLQPIAGRGPAPWNASGLTGRFFQDHIDATLIEVKPSSRRQVHRMFDNAYRSGLKYHPKLKLAPAAQAKLQCLNIGATFTFVTQRAEALAEFRQIATQFRRGHLSLSNGIKMLRRLPNATLFLRQALRYSVCGRAYNPDDGGIFLRVHCEQVPNTESRITLGSERDAVGMFRSRLDWKVTNLEIETMRQFVRIVGNAFAAKNIATVDPHPSLKAGGTELLAELDDSNHHMGATRMADSPMCGVVDSNLRLHGLENGYVCSSSVFPSSGFSNPTHTLIALAARLAEYIASRPGATRR